MAAQLEISDGNPWWLSPDVWVVPGTDPTGQPGSPVANQPAYLWASVHNTGDATAEDATVTFYWANPCTGFDRSTATRVGTANVSLPVGAVAEVLCLTPWIPTFVNDGHECILAEVFLANTSATSAAFNVPTDDRVAQRNLSVLAAARERIVHFAFEVHNPDRLPHTFIVRARQDDVRALRDIVSTTGLDERVLQARGEVADVGFVGSACPDDAELRGAIPEISELRLGPGARGGFSLVARLAGSAALVHVEQQMDERVVGGLSVLLVAQ